MDAQELIQVNLQLPASALDSLARLTEQLQRLAAAVSSPTENASAQARESGENTAFDFARFQDLRVEQVLPEPLAARVTDNVLADVAPVREEVSEQLRQPDPAVRQVSKFVEDPASAGSPSSETAHLETVSPPEFRVMPLEQTVQGEVETDPDAVPAPQPDVSAQIASPRPVQADAETAVSDAQSPAQPEWTRETPLPAIGPDMTHAEAPAEAGFSLAAALDTPRKHWSDASDAFPVPASTPVTPEAVSQAFQRDSRRYDSGFPLY